MLNITIDSRFIIALLLVNTRVNVFFLLLPVFSIIQLPVKIRILFSFMLAFFLLPTLSISPSALSLDSLPLLFINEVFVGAIMAFGVLTALAAFQLGGRFLDLQMGFGVAALIDPTTRQQSALIGSILSLFGIAIFVFEGGHRLLLKALQHSFSSLPVGEWNFTSIDLIINQFGLMFIFATSLVIPVIIFLFLLDAVMAIAARTMPQLNIFILSIPVKIFTGILILSVVITTSQTLLQKIYASIFQYLSAL